jgi:inner membrane protein
MGVGFFIPFDTTRYFLPWRPVRVSPLAPGAFFGPRGLAILRNELVWVWAPCLAFMGLCTAARKRWSRT